MINYFGNYLFSTPSIYLFFFILEQNRTCHGPLPLIPLSSLSVSPISSPSLSLSHYIFSLLYLFFSPSSSYLSSHSNLSLSLFINLPHQSFNSSPFKPPPQITFYVSFLSLSPFLSVSRTISLSLIPPSLTIYLLLLSLSLSLPPLSLSLGTLSLFTSPVLSHSLYLTLQKEFSHYLSLSLLYPLTPFSLSLPLFTQSTLTGWFFHKLFISLTLSFPSILHS